MAAVAMVHETVFRSKKIGPDVNTLLHDLRQPLSSIEAIAYYLEMTIPPQYAEARSMLLKLQNLVQDAGQILDGAEPELQPK